MFNAQVAETVAFVVLPLALVDLALGDPVEDAFALLFVVVPLAHILVLSGCVEGAAQALLIRLLVPLFPELRRFLVRF